MTCATIGAAMLAAAFGLALCGSAALLAGAWRSRRERSGDGERAHANRLCRIGAVLFLAAGAAILGCVVLLGWCFLAGDTSIRYVVYYRSDSMSDLAWLYKLSGIWGGSEGSLLLWAALLAVFGVPAAARCLRQPCGSGEARVLDGAALGVMAFVLAAFAGFTLLVEGNRLFDPLDPSLVDGDGNLVGVAALWGLSALLEHWAMAVHPPLLFVGYAGLAVPFAYAAATLVAGDEGTLWARRSKAPLLVAWVFLGLGIGTGGAWAYTVLGWGGYWGWDAVENASLLPWLSCAALVHRLDALERRALFRPWSLFASCLTFSLVGLDAFITRSGIIGSVHAFAGNGPSAALFAVLTSAPLAVGVAAALAAHVRGRGCGQSDANGAGEVPPDPQAWALYLNNVLVLGFAFVVAYATLAPALPSWMPLGGAAMPAAAYNAIAAPYTAVYLLLLAVCQLVGRSASKGDASAGRGRLLAVAVIAAALFMVVIVFWATQLYPASLPSDGAEQGSVASAMVGPSWYGNAVAVAVLAASCLAFASAAGSLVGGVRGVGRGHRLRGDAPAASSPVGAVGTVRHPCRPDAALASSSSRPAGGRPRARRLSRIGAAVSHAGLAVLAVGLVGSMLYTTSRTVEVPVSRQTGEPASGAASIEVAGYTLDYEGMVTAVDANLTDMFSTATFSVSRDGASLGDVEPSVQAVATTKQTHFHAAILSRPLQDLFVVYKGAAPSTDADSGTMRLVVEVRVNRLIGFVWVGAALLVSGTALSALGSMLAGKSR